MRRIALLLAAAAPLLVVVGTTYGAFSATTGNSGNAFTAKRIFPGTRSTSAWKVEESADGSPADLSHDIAFADGAFRTTSAWSSSWSSLRFLDFVLNGPLPAGLATSGLSFNLTFADSDSGIGNSFCWYFDVRRTSTGAVLGTHGSSGAPVACEVNASLVSVATALPEVTTTAAANDLTIRVYGQHSASKAARIDRATVTGSSYATWTLYPASFVDAATAVPTTSPWGAATAGDSAGFQTGSFSTAYAAARYTKLTFPGFAPTGATLTAAAVDISFRSQTVATTSCIYFEVYDGTTLIGTHGSTTSDLACNTSSITYVNVTESLPEVDTAAEAQSLSIKVYAKNSGSSSGSRAVQFDLWRLNLTFSLAAGAGCATGGDQSLVASRDSWVQEDSASLNNGTSTTLGVKSDVAAVRRTLIGFDYPALPSGCGVTAKLRFFVSLAGGTRTIEVVKSAGTWAEGTVTWSNQPGPTGTGPTTANTAGWREVVVSDLVAEQLAGANTGLYVRDAAEGSGSAGQTLHSRENTNRPTLLLAFGEGAVPYAVDVQAANTGATAGRPEPGDAVTFTFSEAIDPASVLAGWTGASTSVVVRIANVGTGDDTVTVWNAANTSQLPLGSVDLNGDLVGADTVFGSTGTASTMTMSGSTITVTLGTLSSGTVRTGGAAAMTWTPSTTAKDATGNSMTSWTATESGASDLDL